jgi:circadian clock protein KaiB
MADKKKVKPEQAAVLGDVTKSFEAAMAEPGQKYELRLYVAGQTPRSRMAISAIRKICDEYLAGRYDLEVIDIFQDPELGAEAQLFAAPTLIKSLPLPLRRLVGDMSNKNKVLLALNIAPEEQSEETDEAAQAEEK